MTADQLGKLFGVSRRTIQNWVTGAPMAAKHQARMEELIALVEPLGDTPEGRRARIFSSENGPSLYHHLVQLVAKPVELQPSTMSGLDLIGA